MWTFALIVVLVAGLFAGCMGVETANNQKQKKEEKLHIMATDFSPYDFARKVAGDSAEVTMLLAPGQEAHSFEPTPKDIIAIENCDVFVYTGGESEAWVSDILETLDAKIKVVRLMDCVELYEEEAVEGMESHEEKDADDALMDDPEVEYDEHIWTAPANAIKITKHIGEALEQADSVHAKTYKANVSNYVSDLEELDGAFWNVVNHGKRKTLIFGDRFPLRYFVEEYGLSYYAAFPGCASDTEPNAKTVAFLIDKVKSKEIPVVFHVELSNQDMVNTICSETGAKNRQFNAVHNVTKKQFKNGTGYLEMMWDNVEVLKEALE